MNTAIQVEGVSKKYCRQLGRSLYYGVRDIGSELLGREHPSGLRTNEFWAVDNVSFTLSKGESIALIGPNGAGKSTMLRILCGLIRPDRGCVRIQGRAAALLELGTGFDPILSGRENVFVNAAVLGISVREVREQFDAIVDFAELGASIDAPVQNYSSGMKVRLGFSIAAHLRPEVLLVDEILAVGDVGFRMKCYHHVLDLMNRGTALVLVSHAIGELSRVTNRTLVMNEGRPVFDGPLVEGVGHYQLLVNRREQQDRPEASRPRIESVTLRDSSGAPTEEFRTGSSMVADIVLAATEPIPEARLVVAVESPPVGILGGFSTPYTSFKFDVVPPRTTIRLVMEDMPLLVGGYNLNVSFYGPKIVDFHDRLQPAAQFRIVGPPVDAFGYGVCNIFRFAHRWEHVQG